MRVADRLRRSRFLQLAGGALLSLALAPRARHWRPGARSTVALALAARNIGRRYAGDRALFATVSPGVPGRDTALIRFGLNRAATVTLEAVHTARVRDDDRLEDPRAARRRQARAVLDARPCTPGRLVRDATDDRRAARRQTVLGGRRPASIARQQAAVVRVLGVEAAFLRRSYAPGRADGAPILADAPR